MGSDIVLRNKTENGDDFSFEDGRLNYFEKLVISSKPVVLLQGQKLADFNKDTLCLKADDALRDALVSVQADVKKLDEQSKKRISEIAPFVRHLNLSGMEITAEKMENIAFCLVLKKAGEEKSGKSSCIEALTVSHNRLNNGILLTLAKLKKEGFFPKLKKFYVDRHHFVARDDTLNACEEGMRALKQTNFFNDLENAKISLGTSPSQFPQFSLLLFAESAKIKALTCAGGHHDDHFEVFQQHEILQKLSSIRFEGPDLGGERMLKKLADFTDVHLQHFDMHWVHVSTQEALKLAQEGTLAKAFERFDTVTFPMDQFCEERVDGVFSLFSRQNIPLHKISHLKLSGFRINDLLFDDITRNMPHLKQLSLDISRGVDELLGKWSTITTLSLYHVDHKAFDRKNVEIVQKLVQALPGLRTLTLSLPRAEEITDLPFLHHLEKVIVIQRDARAEVKVLSREEMSEQKT